MASSSIEQLFEHAQDLLVGLFPVFYFLVGFAFVVTVMFLIYRAFISFVKRLH